MGVRQIKNSILLHKVRNGIVKKISFGPVELPYHRTKGLKLLVPFPLSIKELEENVDEQKMHNYLIREELSDEKKQSLLAELYEKKLNKKPDLVEPRTFTEKINWMKLHYRNEAVTSCCDKYRLKQYVKEVLGEDLCVKTLQVWENSREIDFESLPNSFVLKVNWSSGYNIFVQNKAKLSQHEKQLIIKQLEIWTEPYSNSYYDSFNWGYKDMEPVIYAEEMLDEAFTRYEYKVFCFNGKPEFTLIEKDPNSSVPERVCVDCEGKRLPFCFGEQQPTEEYKIFECYGKLLEISKRLAVDFPFVRIDFLAREQDFYLGEMTFYSGGGFSHIHPPEWDEKLGDMLSCC